MKKILLAFSILLAGKAFAQVPVKTSETQGAAVQRTAIPTDLPAPPIAGGKEVAAQRIAVSTPPIAGGAAGATQPALAKNAATKQQLVAPPLKTSDGGITPDKAAATIPLRASDNPAKKL